MANPTTDWPDNADNAPSPDLDDFISEVYRITAQSDDDALVAMIVDDYGCSRKEAIEALGRVWLRKTGQPLLLAAVQAQVDELDARYLGVPKTTVSYVAQAIWCDDTVIYVDHDELKSYHSKYRNTLWRLNRRTGERYSPMSVTDWVFTGSDAKARARADVAATIKGRI